MKKPLSLFALLVSFLLPQAAFAADTSPDEPVLAASDSADQPVVVELDVPQPEVENPHFEVMHRFEGQDGWQPFSSLVAYEGQLYGNAHKGGPHGHGVIFRIDPETDEYAIVHAFSGADGSEPMEGLAIVDGMIYGTTKFGGEANYGALFQVRTDGSDYELLHHFYKNRASAFYPHAGPLYHNGILYGTAYHGGSTLWGGAVYAFDLATRTFRLVQSMDARTGRHPTGRLTPAGEWLYGLACDFEKGADGFHGTLFRIHAETEAFEVIHRFEGHSLGGHPYGTLVAGEDGRLYGTTFGEVWQPADPGVVFSLNQDGSDYRVLFDFAKSTMAGCKPNGGLVYGPQKKWLYGQTHGDLDWGGAEPGTLFRIRPDGSEFTVLHHFIVKDNGMVPMREPLLFGDAIYGVTAGGGNYPEAEEGKDPGLGGGVVFRHFIPERHQ